MGFVFLKLFYFFENFSHLWKPFDSAAYQKQGNRKPQLSLFSPVYFEDERKNQS